MTTVSSDIRKISGRLGAEIVGVDLTGPLDAATVSWLSEALHQHKVLGFRGQHLDDAGQLRFASYFGELTTAHPTVPSLEGQPNILPVDSEGGNRANNWHTDVTFVLAPPKATTLRGITIPPYGGNTLFANTAAAYRDLPDPLRAFAETLLAVHTNDYDYAAPNLHKEGHEQRRAQFVSRRFQTVHPVVRVHPATSERGLFIGGFAQRIVGLSNTESRDILRLLQAYVTRPENTIRWQWQPGDVVIWDNRITQHYAPDDYDDLPRRLNRVTVVGDVPIGVDGQRSYTLEGDASHYTPAA
ncbi:MAG TPA: TauD/TfdA family dioxygenase [Jatrophihabitans sp.]|nr:TauD/TfdA family dioxygenase [Jatrophihabitans sp.]